MKAGRWMLASAMAGLIALSVHAQSTPPQDVTLTGVVQGANGLPAANNLLTFTPTQNFYIPGTNSSQFVDNLSGNGVPTGVCVIPNQLYTNLNTTPPTLYQCLNGAWVVLGASGSSGVGYNLLTSGTNTQAAMMVGTGASLGYTGSGTVNANVLGGVAISGAPLAGYVLQATGSGAASWSAPSAGSVTSVGLSLPGSLFTVSNSPVTTSGVLTAAFTTQASGTVFASPCSATGVPSFRAPCATDGYLLTLPGAGVSQSVVQQTGTTLSLNALMPTFCVAGGYTSCSLNENTPSGAVSNLISITSSATSLNSVAGGMNFYAQPGSGGFNWNLGPGTVLSIDAFGTAIAQATSDSFPSLVALRGPTTASSAPFYFGVCQSATCLEGGSLPDMYVTLDGKTHIAAGSLQNGNLICDASEAVAGCPGKPQITTDQIQTSGYTSYRAYGDSYTYGLGSSNPPTTGYVPLLAAYAGVSTGNTTNNGHVGYYMADIATTEVFQSAPPTDNTILQTQFSGINNGLNTPYNTITGSQVGLVNTEPDFIMSNLAAMAFATGGTPQCSGATFGSTAPTGWSFDTSLGGVKGLTSTTNGASFSCTITSTRLNQSFAVFYEMINGNGGQINVNCTCFGGPYAGGYNISNAPNATLGSLIGTTYTPGVLLASTGSSAPGTYTVTVTVISATGSGNVASFLALSMAPSALTSSTPKLWAFGIPQMENYILNGSEMSTLDEDVAQNVRTLRAAGFGVNYIDTRKSFINNLAQSANDGIHPNNTGYAAIASQAEQPTYLVPYQTPSTFYSDTLSLVTVTTSTFNASCNNKTILVQSSVATVVTMPSNCPQATKITIASQSNSGNITFSGPGIVGISGYLGSVAVPPYFQVTAIFNGPYWKVESTNVLGPPITATTGSIGGSALTAGSCATGTATIAYGTAGHPVSVSTSDGSDIGGSFFYRAVVTNSTTVTVSVCAVLAGTPTAKTYNISTY